MVRALLLAARRWRAQPETMPSNVIRHFTYDELRRELRILFQSGKRYVYREVPKSTFDAMKASFSKGEYFNRHIRGQFSFVRVSAPTESARAGPRRQ